MSIIVTPGETVNDVFLFENQMEVQSEGTANNTIVDKDSYLIAYGGATINTTYINGGGEVSLQGVANDTQIFTNGYFVVEENGVASGTVVDGGNFLINSGGIASDTIVRETGSMHVWADGKTGGSTTVLSGGSLTLEWGWLHENVAINGGKVSLKGDTMNSIDALLLNYTIDSGGSLTVSGYGSAFNGTISNGFATVHYMGKIENVELNAATVEVLNGAMLSNATMNAGAVVNVENGANLMDITVNTGAVLTGILNNILDLKFNGGTLDLNIAKMYPGDGVRVSGPVFNVISEGSYSCTLTVDSSAQTIGDYSLIEAVTSFDKTVTVQNTLGETLGTLTVGGDPLVCGILSYTLGLDSAGLFVTVGKGNIITGDVTGETKDVPDGWTALDVNVNTDGTLNVLNGGVASNTTVNNSGSLIVNDGAVARGVTVNNGGFLHFMGTNATGENVKVSAGGKLFADPGTSVMDIDAEEGAHLGLTVAKDTYAAGKYAGTPFEIKEVVDGFTVRGALGINNDGIAINTVVNKDNYVYVSEGGLASMTTLYTDAHMNVASGGTVRIAYVSGGFLYVKNDGLADVVNVGNLGQVNVSSGGVASNVICYQYGNVYVSSGGVAGNVTVNKDGMALVEKDGLLSGLLVNEGGEVWVSAGGKLTCNIKFETGANVTVEDGAIVDFDLTKTTTADPALVNDLSFFNGVAMNYTLTVDGTEADGDYKLAEGATGFDKTITVVNTSGTTLATLTVAGGKTTIGGKDYTLTLNGTGSLGVTVAGGGITPDITGDLSTSFNLTAGMVGSSVNILEGGRLKVLNDGFASQTTVNSGGDLIVSAGGSADIVTVNDGGTMYVYSGAKISNITDETNGQLIINGGVTVTGFVAVNGAKLTLSVAPDTYVQGTYDGNAFELKDAVLSGFTLKTSGYVNVLDGGVTSDVTVSGGLIRVYNGGVAKDTLVSAGGELMLRKEGAVANGVTIKDGGKLTFSEAGGKLTGKVTIETGAIISVCDGAIVDFDLTKTTTADPALVNNLSFFGTAAVNYTLTVDGTEADGDYKLAEGATGFDKTITVVNTSGTTLGTLTVAGGKTTIDGKDYTLTLNGTGSLGVTVAGGGITPDITGDLSTSFDLTAGMVGSSVNILLGGVLDVLNGGFTSQTTVSSGGDLIVDGGGSADVVTVNFGGDLYVSNGATATLVKENGGYASVNDGATVTFVPNSFGGYSYNNAGDWATIHSGTTGTDLTAENGGGIEVHSGGTAVNTTIAADGELWGWAGGKLTGNIKFETGANVKIYDGAIVDFDLTKTTAGDPALVNNLSFFGTAAVNYTLTVDGTEADGDYKLAEGATGFDKTITVVNTSGTTLGTLTVAGGKTTIGGKDYTLTLNGTGSLGVTVAGGGITPDITGDLSTFFDLNAGMVGSSVNILEGGRLDVMNDGFASQTTVNSGGDLIVSAGGSADVVTVNFGGDLYVSNGATATLVKENGGYVNSEWSMTVTFLPNSFGGYSYNNADDWATLHSGTTGTDLTAENGGGILVSSGGIAHNITIGADGVLNLMEGGTAVNTTIAAGGCLGVDDGGKLTGKVTIETGAIVNIYDGAIVDFDLTQTTTADPALVNDLSFFGTAAVNYTLTVDGSQLSGTYNLADGATGFDKTITVMNPLGEEYGTLTVGGSLSTAFADYTLNLSGAALTLDLVAKVVVDTTPPVVENVLADITAPTNGNVTVTADFTDNVAVAQKLFKFNDEPWQDYPTGGVLVTENATVSFKAIDTSSNNSDVVSITIGNIDKIAPTITAITPSTTEPAASVTVTANFADDVALAFQQFKIGDGAWQDYTTGVTVTENGTIYFKAIDAAGNETTDSYEVTNIQTLEPDTTKPTVINVAADITAQTNGNVTVTAEFTDNVAVAYKYYTLSLYDMWQDYPDGGVVVTENNTTVYFEAVDTSGNMSDIVSITIDNIDKEAPTITGITPSTTAPAASVTVTVTFSDNVALAAQQYKIGGGAWQNYVDGVLVTENALVTFKAVDTAGNETTETYDVTNISSGGGTVVTGDVTGETKDINTGMVASDVNVNVNGVLNIFAGGVASKTTVNTEGSLVVSGGSAVQTDVNAGGEIFVSAGGKADNTTVSGGVMRVYDGGSATNTTLQDNGAIIIYVGGVASDTIAETNGWIRVSAGGVAEDVTVKNGGKLIIHEGGKITGKMTFEAGAFASAENNAIVDFNIYPLSPANEALVNNLSILQGTPIYTLTINSAQMLGTYNLANGAVGFDQTITVQSILGAEVGTLTVGGGETKIGDVYYSLGLTGSSLTVTVSSGGETDTTKPVVSNVKADITDLTNKNVTVTASFSDNVAVASSLYRINTGDWQNYTGGVVVTENATVYFKAVDTSGNESDVVSITVGNIDKIPPEKPTASANVTKPTNGSVNVSATFAEDSVQNEYSMDGVNWAPYPGMVKFDDNGTVYFRSTDAAGNISEIESYAVTNIDKVPPAKPTASADITTVTSGNVTVTAVFSGDSVKKEFSLDGLVWQDYAAPLVFSTNGKAYFRGTDAAGNMSAIISYEVTNIQPATPDNAPDDGKNDWVYNKKTKKWNTEDIASFVVNNITSGDSEVRLDKVGSVEKDGKHNYLGRSGEDVDAADYAKIELSKGAALSFSVDSTVAGTFVVLKETKDKKGNLVATQRQKISVKANKTSPAKQTTIYLEAGEYFVGMEGKLPKKGDADAYYNVKLAGTSFFDDADSGWNNTAYKLDGDGKEIKTELNPELVSTSMLFARGATAIQLDTGATGKDGYANWVGFSDATDYRMLTLGNAVNLTLSLTATGKAKLAIWQVSTNAKTGVISLKSKGSVTVKADKTGLVKSKFLEAGTYFVSVESTDAKKGGSAYYNVSVDSATVFFDSADNGKNNELYDKKAKAFYPEDSEHHFETTNVSGAGITVQLDSVPVKADGYKNFVGYQDKIDYAKLNLTTDGNLFFKLKATGDATFTVYRKGQDKKGNDTLETIQTTKLKLAKNASVIDKFTDVISGLTAGEYYISMAATNTSTNAKGSVFYNVTATLEPADADALAMPEASDSLAGSDSLSFGQYGTDALADISSASLAELNEKSAWQSMLA